MKLRLHANEHSTDIV